MVKFMRLTEQQVISIVDAITPFVSTSNVELRLFGSRVDDKLKGGDIDLLLITDELQNKLLSEKYRMLVVLEKRLGERKISLVIATREEIKSDSF